jgi:dihydrofolate reductase
MGKVMFGLSASLDGFIADKNDDVTEVFAWMGRAMERFHEVVGEGMNEAGAVVMGRRSFDCGRSGSMAPSTLLQVPPRAKARISRGMRTASSPSQAQDSIWWSKAKPRW